MNTIGSVTILSQITFNNVEACAVFKHAEIYHVKLITIITSPAKQADRMKVKHNMNTVKIRNFTATNEII